MDKQLKKALLLTGTAALFVRLIYGVLFAATPLAAFNTLPGLDMATLLEFSQWDNASPRSLPMFVLHRFLLFFTYLSAGKTHNFLLIYLVQSLFGITASMFAAWGVWQLSKSFRATLIAGIIYALYGPFLLYESVALQESILTHTLIIGFAIWMNFVDKRSTICGVISGIILGLNSSGRPATAFLAAAMAIYPLWVHRKEKFSVANLSFLFSLAAVWFTATLFNGYFRQTYNPFFNVMPHLTEVHAPQSATESSNIIISYFKVFFAAVKNVPYHFGMREIPENLDYDVIRKILPILFFGPLLVMPFAVAGIISMALLKRKELISCYIATLFLALPLAARIPIGRYRLLLMPFFIIFAALFIEELIKNKDKRLALIGIFIGVIGTNLCLASPLVRPNPAAHHTLALASMRTKANPLPHLEEAWKTSNYTYKPSGLMLVIHHMKTKNFEQAENTIKQNRTNAPEFFYYHALIKTAKNQPKEAIKLLQKIENPKDLNSLYPKYIKLYKFLTSL